ncbi:MAG: 1-(5-phosphoribosyl)-5-[(5-phosphoribosylamino)methylideneamino]imidazole-4-carboxamide isomerase [Candidatus Hadarchaeota archaeon]
MRKRFFVIPSVDIMQGECVQMVGGRLGTEVKYGDPVEQAMRWVSEGAECLHVIDLDAAMGKGDNLVKIAELVVGVSIQVQVGGGIRSLERAFEMLGIGAERVILGTAAVRDEDFVRALVEMVGGARVMVAIDSRGGAVIVEGWKKKTGLSPVELAQKLEKLGVGSLIFTSVDVEGSMGGAATGETEEVVEAVKIPVIAAGGVGSLDDIWELRDAGTAGVIIGKALYEGKFTLAQAMEVAKE